MSVSFAMMFSGPVRQQTLGQHLFSVELCSAPWTLLLSLVSSLCQGISGEQGLGTLVAPRHDTAFTIVPEWKRGCYLEAEDPGKSEHHQIQTLLTL